MSAITATTPYELDSAFPNLEGLNRLERASKIANTPKAIRKVNAKQYVVKSQQGLVSYVVSEDAEGNYKCSCPDHLLNGCECKHILAVKLYNEEKNAKLAHQKSEFPRDWANYSLGQMKEGELFDELLKELVNTIDEPVHKGRGRKSLPLSDKLFCAVKKVSGMKSLRRSQSGFNQAESDGIIESSCHYNTVSNTMCDASVTPILHELVRLSASPLAEIEHNFSIDSSGFRTTNFNTWIDEKYGEQRKHAYLKCHIASGNLTNVVSDVVITENCGEGSGDVNNFPALLAGTSGKFIVREIMADAAYISRENFAAADKIDAEPFIYFKSNTNGKAKGCPAWTQSFIRFMTNHAEWLEHYNKRNNVETTFGAIKAKFGEALKSKDVVAQKNELLCKILSYNISVLISAIFCKDIKVGF